jgi:ketosteroid isomerase-like protein
MSTQQTPLHELLRAFDNAVDVFNARDTDKLADVFRDDVILIKAKPNKPPIVGKAAALEDFEERFKKPVRFTPTSVDASAKDSFGVVTGVGQWLDKESQKEMPIQYVFIFQKEAGKWRIRTLWGSPSHS